MATSKPSHLQDKNSGLPQGRRTPTSRSSPGKPATDHLKSSTKSHHPSPCASSPSTSSSRKQRSIPSRKPLENPASTSRLLHKSPTPSSATKERTSKTTQPLLPKHSTAPSKTLSSGGRVAVPSPKPKTTAIAASNTLKRKTSIGTESSSPAAAGEKETLVEPATDATVLVGVDVAAPVAPELEEEDHSNPNLVQTPPPVEEELEELANISDPEQQEELTNLESGSEIAGEEDEEVQVHDDDHVDGDGGKEAQAAHEQKTSETREEAAMAEGETSQSGGVDEKRVENVEVQRAEKQRRREAPPAGNTVIEETASKLAEKRKNRVLALIGAFETVISLQEHEGGGALLADKE